MINKEKSKSKDYKQNKITKGKIDKFEKKRNTSNNSKTKSEMLKYSTNLVK